MNTRTRIKICGLTREADVDAAVQAGADAIGFVLYERSARHVGLQRAAAGSGRKSTSNATRTACRSTST